MNRQEGIFWHSSPSEVLSPDSCDHCHFPAGVGILPTALQELPSYLLLNHSLEMPSLSPSFSSSTQFLFSVFQFLCCLLFIYVFRAFQRMYPISLVLLLAIQVVSLLQSNNHMYLLSQKIREKGSYGFPSHSSVFSFLINEF